VLETLNESMLAAPTQGRFCTVAYVELAPRAGGHGGHLSVACGGHPPPVVVRHDGVVEELPAIGSIIGAFTDLSLTEAQVELAAGDTLVLFTDGVTEAGTGTDRLGDTALREILLSCAGTTAADLAAWTVVSRVLLNLDETITRE
jgi:serine phosphatase RsbU (regulator of sigma subunit)